MEDFRIHPIYTNYAANRFGVIINVKTKKIMSQCFNNWGYYFFVPYLNKERKTYSSHRFIYECFNGSSIPESLVIDHKNNIKTDNTIENLQLFTQKQNIQKSFNIDNPNHKSIKEITIVFEDGSEQKFRSIALAARTLNASYVSISMCRTGRCKIFTNRYTGERYTVKKP